MKSSNNRNSRTVTVDMTSEWRMFDALPSSLRQLIAFAPYNYTVLPLGHFYRNNVERLGLAEVESRIVRGMVTDVGREALHFYGARHPQAVA